MAIPSGGGSETLQRGSIKAQLASQTRLLFDGTAETTTGDDSGNTVLQHHIIILLSITLCAVGGANTIYLQQYNGSNLIAILDGASISAGATYVWNEKTVLHYGDYYYVNMGSGTAVDVNYVYIDQNWED